MISLKIRDNFFSCLNILRQQQQQQSKVHFRFYFHFRAKKTKQLSRVFSFLCNFKSQPASTLIDHLISLRSIFFSSLYLFYYFWQQKWSDSNRTSHTKKSTFVDFRSILFSAEKKKEKKCDFCSQLFFGAKSKWPQKVQLTNEGWIHFSSLFYGF